MLTKNHTTKQSAPNFGAVNMKRDSGKSESNQKRKPILKKISMPLNSDEVENQHDKENFDSNFAPIIVQALEISKKKATETVRKIQHKKKSIFLELDELRNSTNKKHRSNSKKISFLPLTLSNSQFDEYPVQRAKNNYKQSKIDILLSSSNMGSFWNNSTQENLDFDAPEKSSQMIKSSEVVQPMPKQPTSIMLKLRKQELYTAKKSDRIIQKADTKRENEQDTPKKIEETTKKIEETTKKIDQTLSLSQSSSNPLSTAESNFFKKSIYEQKFFPSKKKITTPEISLKQIHEKSFKGKRQKQEHNQTQKVLSSKQEHINLRTANRKPYTIKIDDSQRQNLFVTLNPVSSQLLVKSFPEIQGGQNHMSMDDQFFEIINGYRLLNRLCYKVKKYMFYPSNQSSYNQLIAEMTRLKCFILLNAQLELQTLHSFQNRSQSCASEFMEIIQSYIEKQRLQAYWKNAENQFLRLTKSPHSLNDKVVTFFEETLSEFENQLKASVLRLRNQLRTKETLQIELKLKILKHLFYDVLKMNLFDQRQLPVSFNTNDFKKQRLKALIEKDKWLEKVPLNQIEAQYEQLKNDFSYLTF